MTTILKVFENSKGQAHNEEGPAVIWADGVFDWYINGKPHREDGPARVEYGNNRFFIRDTIIN